MNNNNQPHPNCDQCLKTFSDVYGLRKHADSVRCKASRESSLPQKSAMRALPPEPPPLILTEDKEAPASMPSM